MSHVRALWIKAPFKSYSLLYFSFSCCYLFLSLSCLFLSSFSPALYILFNKNILIAPTRLTSFPSAACTLKSSLLRQWRWLLTEHPQALELNIATSSMTDGKRSYMVSVCLETQFALLYVLFWKNLNSLSFFLRLRLKPMKSEYTIESILKQSKKARVSCRTVSDFSQLRAQIRDVGLWLFCSLVWVFFSLSVIVQNPWFTTFMSDI